MVPFPLGRKTICEPTAGRHEHDLRVPHEVEFLLVRPLARLALPQYTTFLAVGPDLPWRVDGPATGAPRGEPPDMFPAAHPRRAFGKNRVVSGLDGRLQKPAVFGHLDADGGHFLRRPVNLIRDKRRLALLQPCVRIDPRGLGGRDGADFLRDLPLLVLLPVVVFVCYGDVPGHQMELYEVAGALGRVPLVEDGRVLPQLLHGLLVLHHEILRGRDGGAPGRLQFDRDDVSRVGGDEGVHLVADAVALRVGVLGRPAPLSPGLAVLADLRERDEPLLVPAAREEIADLAVRRGLWERPGPVGFAGDQQILDVDTRPGLPRQIFPRDPKEPRLKPCVALNSGQLY